MNPVVHVGKQLRRSSDYFEHMFFILGKEVIALL